jgi:hypothetical protein
MGGAAAGAKTGALQFMVPRSVRPSAWMELHAPTSTRSCRLNATPGRSTDRGGASFQNLAFPAAAAAAAPAGRRDPFRFVVPRTMHAHVLFILLSQLFHRKMQIRSPARSPLPSQQSLPAHREFQFEARNLLI